MFREIDTAIFETVLSGTPLAASPQIVDLCAEIATGVEPEFILHEPSQDAVVRECFNNVAERVRRIGGDLVYGWAIWEWPGVFIEAEHHAVWRSPDGVLIDITPHEYPTHGVLFLPDPLATYDFKGFTRRDNVRRPASPLSAVAEFLSVSELIFQKLESSSVGKEYRLSPSDLNQLQAMEDRKSQLKVSIYFHLAKGKGPNDVCFCRSGKKFKKCCSRYFR